MEHKKLLGCFTLFSIFLCLNQNAEGIFEQYRQKQRVKKIEKEADIYGSEQIEKSFATLSTMIDHSNKLCTHIEKTQAQIKGETNSMNESIVSTLQASDKVALARISKQLLALISPDNKKKMLNVTEMIEQWENIKALLVVFANVYLEKAANYRNELGNILSLNAPEWSKQFQKEKKNAQKSTEKYSKEMVVSAYKAVVACINTIEEGKAEIEQLNASVTNDLSQLINYIENDLQSTDLDAYNSIKTRVENLKSTASDYDKITNLLKKINIELTRRKVGYINVATRDGYADKLINQNKINADRIGVTEISEVQKRQGVTSQADIPQENTDSQKSRHKKSNKNKKAKKSSRVVVEEHKNTPPPGQQVPAAQQAVAAAPTPQPVEQPAPAPTADNRPPAPNQPNRDHVGAEAPEKVPPLPGVQPAAAERPAATEQHGASHFEFNIPTDVPPLPGVRPAAAGQPAATKQPDASHFEFNIPTDVPPLPGAQPAAAERPAAAEQHGASHFEFNIPTDVPPLPGVQPAAAEQPGASHVGVGAPTDVPPLPGVQSAAAAAIHEQQTPVVSEVPVVATAGSMQTPITQQTPVQKQEVKLESYRVLKILATHPLTEKDIENVDYLVLLANNNPDILVKRMARTQKRLLETIPLPVIKAFLLNPNKDALNKAIEALDLKYLPHMSPKDGNKYFADKTAKILTMRTLSEGAQKLLASDLLSLNAANQIKTLINTNFAAYYKEGVIKQKNALGSDVTRNRSAYSTDMEFAKNAPDDATDMDTKKLWAMSTPLERDKWTELVLPFTQAAPLPQALDSQQPPAMKRPVVASEQPGRGGLLAEIQSGIKLRSAKQRDENR